MTLTWLWSALALGGFLLVLWAYRELRIYGVKDMRPVPLGKHRVITGPYHLLAHPMYWGNVACLAGLGGLGGGIWGALATGLLAELLMRDWISREEGR